jgi:hypothetical protein
MKPNFALVLLVLLAFGVSLRAEDWTTIGGTVYRDVKVLKTEPDAVTIIYRDGGALIPLKLLPDDLQKRFHYDPSKARAAADERIRNDESNFKALSAERLQAAELEKKKQAKELAQQQAARAYLKSLSDSYNGVDFGSLLMDPNNFVGGNVWNHLTNDPTPHYNKDGILEAAPQAQTAPGPLVPANGATTGNAP